MDIDRLEGDLFPASVGTKNGYMTQQDAAKSKEVGPTCCLQK